MLEGDPLIPFCHSHQHFRKRSHNFRILPCRNRNQKVPARELKSQGGYPKQLPGDEKQKFFAPPKKSSLVFKVLEWIDSLEQIVRE